MGESDYRIGISFGTITGGENGSDSGKKNRNQYGYQPYNTSGREYGLTLRLSHNGCPF